MSLIDKATIVKNVLKPWTNHGFLGMVPPWLTMVKQYDQPLVNHGLP